MIAEHEFDVALSFAGEDREYVERVATALKREGVSVFYDQFDEAALWGKDLYEHLDDVYRRRARYCVMFISRHYAGKAWARHERKSAQARVFKEHAEYILPVRFDDTEIPGVLPTVGYVDLRTRSPDDLAVLVLTKLGRRTQESEVSEFRRPKLDTAAFNPYDEALGFIRHVAVALDARARALSSGGLSLSSFEREGRRCLRFVTGGRCRYSLDMWLGAMTSDSSIGFHGSPGEARSVSRSMNAWGEVRRSRDRGEGLVLVLNDLSLLGHVNSTIQLTYDAFVDALWDRICDALENRS